MEIRAQIIESIYRNIKKPYQQLFRKNKEAWPITISDLLQYPDGSLGATLGIFLTKNHFELQPSLEEHDVYHILTKTGTTVKDEINMQFYLLGNGKRSLFSLIVIATGLLFYPLEWGNFMKLYKKGRNALQFYHLDFYRMLALPISDIQQTFNIR